MVRDDIEDDARYTSSKGTDDSHFSYRSTTDGNDLQGSDDEDRRNSKFSLGRCLKVPDGSYWEY